MKSDYNKIKKAITGAKLSEAERNDLVNLLWTPDYKGGVVGSDKVLLSVQTTSLANGGMYLYAVYGNDNMSLSEINAKYEIYR